MLEVERGHRAFDIQKVLDGVSWAYKRSQAEDTMFSVRNSADDVEWSSITRALQGAYEVLLEMQLWEPANASPNDS